MTHKIINFNNQYFLVCQSIKYDHLHTKYNNKLRSTWKLLCNGFIWLPKIVLYKLIERSILDIMSFTKLFFYIVNIVCTTLLIDFFID